jgi:sulfur carrier protein
MLKSPDGVNRFPGRGACLQGRPGLHSHAMITVTLGDGKTPVAYEKIKTVLQLLSKLNLRVNDALVIRDGELLTPDRHLRHDDHVIVRPVVSRG